MSITWLSWPNRTSWQDVDSRRGKGKAWGEEQWDFFVCCVVSRCIVYLCMGFSCFILGHGLLQQRAKDGFCQDLMTHVISWRETHFQMQLNSSFFALMSSKTLKGDSHLFQHLYYHWWQKVRVATVRNCSSVCHLYPGVSSSSSQPEQQATGEGTGFRMSQKKSY